MPLITRLTVRRRLTAAFTWSACGMTTVFGIVDLVSRRGLAHRGVIEDHVDLMSKVTSPQPWFGR